MVRALGLAAAKGLAAAGSMYYASGSAVGLVFGFVAAAAIVAIAVFGCGDDGKPSGGAQGPRPPAIRQITADPAAPSQGTARHEDPARLRPPAPVPKAPEAASSSIKPAEAKSAPAAHSGPAPKGPTTFSCRRQASPPSAGSHRAQPQPPRTLHLPERRHGSSLSPKLDRSTGVQSPRHHRAATPGTRAAPRAEGPLCADPDHHEHGRAPPPPFGRPSPGRHGRQEKKGWGGSIPVAAAGDTGATRCGRLISPSDRRWIGRPVAGTSGRRKEELPSCRSHILVVERSGSSGRCSNELGRDSGW
ncbi:hypothetical protein ZWY2020_012543 [Hordeum vulgare]|nr:hypothetical protein ZWY2020_012543 [Hordeum vulgare]